MSTKMNRLRESARRSMRTRRDQRAFTRAYDQASPSMQAELLVLSQRQSMGG